MTTITLNKEKNLSQQEQIIDQVNGRVAKGGKKHEANIQKIDSLLRPTIFHKKNHQPHGNKRVIKAVERDVKMESAKKKPQVYKGDEKEEIKILKRKKRKTLTNSFNVKNHRYKKGKPANGTKKQINN